MPIVPRAFLSRPAAPDISHAAAVDSNNRPLLTTRKANPSLLTATNLPPRKLVHTGPSDKGAISDSNSKALTKTSSISSTSRSPIPGRPSPSNIALHVPATKTTIHRSAPASQPFSPSRTFSAQRQSGITTGPPIVTISYTDTKPSSYYSKKSEINYHHDTDITLTEAQRTTSQRLPISSASPSTSSPNFFSGTEPSNKSKEKTVHANTTRSSPPVSQPPSISTALPNAGNPASMGTTSKSHKTISSEGTDHTTSAQPVPASTGSSLVVSSSQHPSSTKSQGTSLSITSTTSAVNTNGPPQSRPPQREILPTSTSSAGDNGQTVLPNTGLQQSSSQGGITTSTNTIFTQELTTANASFDTNAASALTRSFSKSVSPVSTTTKSRPTMTGSPAIRVETTGTTSSGLDPTTSPSVNSLTVTPSPTTATSSKDRGPRIPFSASMSAGSVTHTDSEKPSHSSPGGDGSTHGKGKNNDGMSAGEKDAIIGGSVAAAISIITLILVLVALLICRRKQRRERAAYQQQLPVNTMNASGMPGVSYIPVFPVSAAPPYQQAFPLPNQKAELQTLELSNDKHPSLTPVYDDATQSVDGTIFKNITPIETFKPASYVDDQGRMYSSHRNQDSATSSDIEDGLEERPSSGHVQEHLATESTVLLHRIKSANSDTSVQFGVAL